MRDNLVIGHFAPRDVGFLARHHAGILEPAAAGVVLTPRIPHPRVGFDIWINIRAAVQPDPAGAGWCARRGGYWRIRGRR